MTAAVISETVLGFPMDNAPSNVGTAQGLVWGIYNATSVNNTDYVNLTEFAEIKFVVCYKIDTGALVIEPVSIHPTIKNRLSFTTGGTDDIRILVFGTPA